MSTIHDIVACRELLDAQPVEMQGRIIAGCSDCTKAAAGVWHGFSANCLGCCARATARGPNFARVRTTGMQDQLYRRQLQQFGLTHDQVKAAANNDFTMNGKAEQCSL